MQHAYYFCKVKGFALGVEGVIDWGRLDDFAACVYYWAFVENVSYCVFSLMAEWAFSYTGFGRTFFAILRVFVVADV